MFEENNVSHFFFENKFIYPDEIECWHITYNFLPQVLAQVQNYSKSRDMEHGIQTWQNLVYGKTICNGQSFQLTLFELMTK